MKLNGARVLLTGAAGGIGSEIALELARKGVEITIADRASLPLEQLHLQLAALNCKSHIVVCDLAEQESSRTLAGHAIDRMGSVDVLINCAGISSFAAFADETPDAIDRLWRINVIAPMQLTHAVLPHMTSRGGGRIVNIGSVFGSIGFAYFTAYSASKFAMRGFSESLRRELEGSGVGVTYVAPRFTRTPLNTAPINRMAQAVGMKGDDPHVVAAMVVRAIEQDKKDCYIGWPESLFVRINAVLPRLVDIALRKQNTQMRDFAVAPLNETQE